MVTLNLSNLIPSIGNLTVVKVFVKTAIATVFSPIPLLITLLLTLGVIYLISLVTYNLVNEKHTSKEQNKFVKKVFMQNKSVITIALLVGFALNFFVNENTIVMQTTAKTAQYEKVCTFIAQKELAQGLSDAQVAQDMDESNCNSKSLPFIELFNQLFGQNSHNFPVTPRGNWSQRDTNQA
jgi:hypothetical protein